MRSSHDMDNFTADRSSAARIAMVSANYDWQCRQPAAAESSPGTGTPDRMEVPCKLAPAILRRVARTRPH
jgi:hypothetical protein